MGRMEQLEIVHSNALLALTLLASDEKFEMRVRRHIRKMKRANAHNTIGGYAAESVKNMAKAVGGAIWH